MEPVERLAGSAADLREEIGPVYAFVASRIGPHRAAVEDLTQETFLAAIQGRYDPSRGTLRGWLFGIAIRKIADHERGKRASGKHLADAARELAVRMIREPLPEDWVGREEVRAVVNGALARLPEATSALLIRKYFEGATVLDLSAELGISEKAVESQLTRARSLLHEAVERFRETGE